MMRRLILIVALAIALYSVAVAQAPAFQKDDRVCFLGDSIFHGGKVHSDLLLFYATRFPEAPMVFYNAGVAGDMTKEAIRRVDWDVRPFAPRVTVIMFGMNDVGRWLYGADDPSQAVLDQRKSMMGAHVANLDRLVGQLKAMGSRIIICTPTPFDETTTQPTGNAKGVDDALGLVAANARRFAQAGGYGLVDFHEEMNKVIRQQQGKDATFTMMDGARVHPDDAGNMLMAYAFLRAQGMTAIVSRVVLDASTAKAVRVDNCAVTNVAKSGDGLVFGYLAKALPYPLGGKVLGWVPFMDDLDQEVLQISNLGAGNYELVIDGQSVGTYSAADLAKGVNLAGNVRTPQYKQAAAAMELNEKRRQRENSTLRIFAALEHDVLRPKGVDTSDMAAVRAAMDKAIEEEGQNKTWRHSYFINLSKVYYGEKPKQAQIEKELAEMSGRVFEMCKPQAHQYEVRAAK